MARIGRVVAVLVAILVAAPASAETRIALVVGNGGYSAPRMALPNPPADARLVAGLLERVGFSVDLVVDGGREQMYEALDRFAAKAETADVALFYFAGHGIQDLGQNFLMPVDAELKRQRDLRDRFVPLDDVVQSLSQARGAKILVLDACRDNEAVDALRAAVPRSRSAAVTRGLAPMPKVSGMLVAFATQPGVVATDGSAANSPFTEALARHLAEPGLELRQVLTRVRIDVARATEQKQIPEVSDSLLGEVVLVPRTSGPAFDSAITAPANAEIAFWNSVEAAKSPALYRAYLDRYGADGTFAAIARDRIMQDLKDRSVLIGPLQARVASLGEDLRRTISMPETGVVVAEVVTDGPADRAGLEAGDIVLTLDGRRIADPPALVEIVELLPYRDVELRIARDGALFVRKAKLDAAAEPERSDVAAAPAAATTEETQSPTVSPDPEVALWTEAEAAKSPALYRGYLDRYGFKGAHAATAYDRIMDDLRARKARVGLMGIKIQALTDEVRATLSLSEEGVLVAEVGAGPAQRAGILVGDVVLSLDGRPVTTPRELAYRIALSPDREVEIGISRAGSRFLAKMKVESHILEPAKP